MTREERNARERARYAASDTARERKREYARIYRAANLARETANAADRYRATMADPVKAAARREYNRDKQRERAVRAPERVRDNARASMYRRKYGITEADVVALIAGQGGCCKLCRKLLPDTLDRRVHVDHDHTTGAIRGILCSGCNTALGVLGDDEAGLLRALAYVRGQQLADLDLPRRKP